MAYNLTTRSIKQKLMT